ncbi:hypothetical protein [Kiloniella majae]|uniref:hypothetical protein n=1 Tax=Kiloniella majae TaxID=1938558 RepID=UPI000A2792B3|nr:hypothetical protein [Kiloniella majae]
MDDESVFVMNYSKALQLVGFFVVFLNTAQPAYAYLDPGTGSIIIQSIIGGIAAAATFGALYWAKVKAFFNRIFHKEPNDSNSNTK